MMYRSFSCRHEWWKKAKRKRLQIQNVPGSYPVFLGWILLYLNHISGIKLIDIIICSTRFLLCLVFPHPWCKCKMANAFKFFRSRFPFEFPLPPFPNFWNFRGVQFYIYRIWGPKVPSWPSKPKDVSLGWIVEELDPSLKESRYVHWAHLRLALFPCCFFEFSGILHAAH